MLVFVLLHHNFHFASFKKLVHKIQLPFRKNIQMFTSILLLVILFQIGARKLTTSCSNNGRCLQEIVNTTDSINCNDMRHHADIVGDAFALESFQPQSQFQRAQRNVRLGFTGGGSSDLNTFRRNIQNGYLPIPPDVTDEGLFSEYHFNFNKPCEARCTQAFCPTYNIAVSPDPINNQILQTYLAMGIHSNMFADNLPRPVLNLIFLIDISRSMNYGFNGESPIQQNPYSFESKLQVSSDVLADMVDLLDSRDSVGVITFQSNAQVVVPLQQVGITQPGEIKQKVRSLSADGRTNLQQPLDLALHMLTQYNSFNNEEQGNRIILITDAQVNEGDLSVQGLVQRIDNLQRNNIHTTIVGVGLDFNTQLADLLTSTRGANYYSVESKDDFRSVLIDNFNYMVYPLVYDLQLQLHEESQKGWKIIKAYGSGNDYEAIQKNGVVLKIPTLFPSPENEQGIRGGVVLAAMKQLKPDVPLKLKVSYVNRTNLYTYEVESVVDLPFTEVQPQGQYRECRDYDSEKCALISAMPGLCTFEEIQRDCVKSCGGPACQSSLLEEWYDTIGMRKAVLLVRYADLLRSWLLEEWEIYVQLGTSWCEGIGEDHQRNIDGTCTIMEWLTAQRSLIPTPDQVLTNFSKRWERELQRLKVSEQAIQAFRLFLEYLKQQIDVIGDQTLQQEAELLQNLIQQFGN
eukprot:TRINITY_DN3813_c0_g1_i4.p1 TRINITY_DN3813_c0_g1~~TRINITY_DN3813_c0_g1_i4.p1  ORF type:complete len:687 (-),score=30.46 TRINITY_DN3813_c0_g1_i4:105-2165(-)